MFYFDDLNGQRILRSDFLDKSKFESVDAFFTTRGVDIQSISDFAKRIITPEQTHSDHIVTVDEKEEYPRYTCEYAYFCH